MKFLCAYLKQFKSDGLIEKRELGSVCIWYNNICSYHKFHKGGSVLSTVEKTSMKETYTVKEVSEILGICTKTTYRLIKEGYFPVVKIGRVIRISKKSFDNWLNNLVDV